MTPYRIARVDSEQPAIVAALRQAGATVLPMHTLGHGAPDILVGFKGRNWAMEVKGAEGKLTVDEQVWHAMWRGQVCVVRTAEEALRAIGVL